MLFATCQSGFVLGILCCGYAGSFLLVVHMLACKCFIAPGMSKTATSLFHSAFSFLAVGFSTNHVICCRLEHAPSAELMAAFSQEASNKLQQFAPQNISNMLWAYATLGHSPGLHHSPVKSFQLQHCLDVFSAGTLPALLFTNLYMFCHCYCEPLLSHHIKQDQTCCNKTSCSGDAHYQSVSASICSADFPKHCVMQECHS